MKSVRLGGNSWVAIALGQHFHRKVWYGVSEIVYRPLQEVSFAISGIDMTYNHMFIKRDSALSTFEVAYEKACVL